MNEKDINQTEVYRDLQAEASNRFSNGAGKTIQHLIDGFNKLSTRIPEIFTGDKPFETRSGERYRIEFDSWVKPIDTTTYKSIVYKKQTERNTLYKGELWPYDARVRKMNYMASLRMRVVKIGASDEKGSISEPFEIMKLPVMLRSDLCYLSGHAYNDENEPHPSLMYEQENEVGGYFIILGREMVVLLQDHSVFNRDLVLRIGKKKEHLGSFMTIRHLSTTKQVSVVIEVFKSKGPVIQVDYHSFRKVESGQRGINLGDAFILLGIKVEDIPKFFRLMSFGEEVSENEIFSVIRQTLSSASRNIEECKNSIRATDREAYNLPVETGSRIAYENFIADLFPQIKNNQAKACMLAYMAIRAIRVYLGKDEVDDQNKTSNKQFQTPANVIEKLVQQLWRKIRYEINEEISSPTVNSASAIANIILSKSKITNRIIDSFNTGRWGPENDPQTGVVEETTRELGIVPIINRLTRIVVSGGRKTSSVKVESRMVDPEQTGVVCYFTTPDSDQIGKTRNLSWATRISLEVDGNSIINSIVSQVKSLINPLHIHDKGEDIGLIFINAYPIGWGNLKTVFEAVRNLRRQGKIKHLDKGKLEPYFELSLGIRNGCLWMNTSSGRAYTPRIIVYQQMINVGGYQVRTQFTLPLENKTWDELLSTGVVEYIDPFELQHVVIADLYLNFLKNEDTAEERIIMLNKLVNEGKTAEAESLYKDIKRDEINTFKTHLAIDPTDIYALTAVIAPFANRIAGVRLALQSKMAAQAISHQAPQHEYYMGQKYRQLVYNTAPVVCTSASVRSHQEFGFGDQIIVAFISLQGNQEDSIIWRKGAIDSGKLMVEVYTTEEMTAVNTGAVHKIFMKPFPRANENPDIYSYLGRDGLPEPGDKLNEGQIVIGVATCEMGKCSNYMKLAEEYYNIEDGIEVLQIISEETYERDRRVHLQRWNLIDKNLSQSELLQVLVERKTEKLKEIQEAADQPRWSDSVIVPPKKSFVVDKVALFDNELGARTVRVKLRSLRRPRVADKQNPRASQKATIGEIWNDEDMPFFWDGKTMMKPDAIVNSLAPFARQTNAWFLEMMTGLLDAVGGTRTLADAHRPFDIDWLFRRLRDIGYRERSVPMINGRTGEYFGVIDAQTGTFTEATVFIGPSYQTALKHQVQDKGQVRGIGKRDLQTGLGVKGRNTPAGVRFGNMEAHAVETHGAANVLVDRLRDSTAKTDKVICNICGVEAVFNVTHFSCRRCKTSDYNNFTRVEISRATEYVTKTLGMGNIIVNYKTDAKKISISEDIDEEFEEDEEEEEDFDDDFDDLDDDENYE